MIGNDSCESFEYDYGSDEYDGFDTDSEGGSASEKPPKVKTLEPTVAIEELRSNFLVPIVDAINVTNSVACKVMTFINWDIARLGEVFEDKDRIFEKLGLRSGQEASFAIPTSDDEIECPLCLCDNPANTCISLISCSHTACSDCWRGLIEAAIKSGRECTKMTCFHGTPSGQLKLDGCRTTIEEDLVRKVIPADSPLLSRYNTFIMHSVVEMNPNYRWCPGRECSKVLWCEEATDSCVTCESCGEGMCFQCGEEWHVPTTCKELKAWKDKEHNDGDNIKYMIAYTKACPRCQVLTERNQGCNHMVCKLCADAGKEPNDWCWECGKPWGNEHEGKWYNCPLSSDEEVKAQSRNRIDAQSEITRFLSYYSEYVKHEQIRRMVVQQDQQRASEYEKKLKAAFAEADTAWLTAAVKGLIDARRQMKFVYVHAYNMTQEQVTFYNFKIGDLEGDIAKFATMLEDLYRHGEAATSKFDSPLHSPDSVKAATAVLKSRLANVLSGN
eukprot:TRINITY_DN60516_c0_g1_i1.p2 TRINITY_DN60516_c0_g1~~TRINITY_DN60516_c0_g1_i1.p2  ORF type:complete len:500 (-),score=29.52 TRINITY_DN60516_c0_g1_i1:2675-4174(-)